MRNPLVHRSIATSGLAAAIVLAIAGCGGGGASSSSTADAQLPAVDVNVPSQDQADSAAEKSISQANADESFQKLQKEIEAESGGD